MAIFLFVKFRYATTKCKRLRNAYYLTEIRIENDHFGNGPDH